MDPRIIDATKHFPALQLDEVKFITDLKNFTSNFYEVVLNVAEEFALKYVGANTTTTEESH